MRYLSYFVHILTITIHTQERKCTLRHVLQVLAFNSASLGLNHGIAHAIGAKFHIPHGRANAMLLPHVIEYNSGINKHSRSQSHYPKCVEKYVNVAKLLGVNNFNEITTVRALVSWIQFMLKEMTFLFRFTMRC